MGAKKALIITDKFLKELGVKEKDFETMADLALQDGNAFSNLIQGNKEDIISILKSGF